MKTCGLFLLSIALLSTEIQGHENDHCKTDDNCNGTATCCHRKDTSSICKKSCLHESCTSSWDCGTMITLRCCSDQVCRESYDMCPDSDTWPIWVTVVVALSVSVAVLGIVAVILAVYIRHRRASQPGLLAQDSLTSSAYSTRERSI